MRKFIEELKINLDLVELLPGLSGKRFVCHCLLLQVCHANSIAREYRTLFPDAYDTNATSGLPSQSALRDYLATSRLEPDDDSDTTSDEGEPPEGAGWDGRGKPVEVGARHAKSATANGQWIRGGIMLTTSGTQ